jgi:hypothetical protein
MRNVNHLTAIFGQNNKEKKRDMNKIMGGVGGNRRGQRNGKAGKKGDEIL